MADHGFISREHIEKIAENEAKFLLDHAEKALKDTLENNNLIVGRTTTLLTITVGMMTELAGFAITMWSACNLDAMIWTAFIVLLYLYITTIFMVDNVQPKKYIIIGAAPSDFFNNNFFGNAFAEKDRLKYFYLNEVHNIQKRITENKTTNERRWTRFRVCLYFVAATPVVLVVVFSIASSILSASPLCLLGLIHHLC
jgi:hypothetical protein